MSESSNGHARYDVITVDHCCNEGLRLLSKIIAAALRNSNYDL